MNKGCLIFHLGTALQKLCENLKKEKKRKNRDTMTHDEVLYM